MVKQTELSEYLKAFLSVDRYPDYCPNGLQVAGCDEIQVLISGVTACQALLDAAIVHQADAIIVHHGYFWKQEDPCVTGIKRQRLATLLQHNLNLFVYHLPLDLHPEVGNNVQLAKQLGIRVINQFDVSSNLPLGFVGELPQPYEGRAWAEHVQRNLQRTPLHIEGQHSIRRIAWCTGAAQNYLTEAVLQGVDAYMTGEVSESTVHTARELGVHFFAAGHHATERYGVQALGTHLADRFNLTHHFIDIDNPA